MLQQLRDLNEAYIHRLQDNPEWALKEFRRIQKDAEAGGATYDGKPVPFPPKPYFVSDAQHQILGSSVQILLDILEKFIGIFLEDAQLQKMWGVSDHELELYRVDPGYERAIQVARLDALLHGPYLRYLEFNCDSPGGNGDAKVIHQAFWRFFEESGFAKDFAIRNDDGPMRIAATLRTCYDQWRANGHADRPDDPFVVVCDWRDVKNLPDIEINVKHLKSKGYDAVFADPRDMTFDGSKLTLDGRTVDVVYKRVIVKELLDDPGTQPLRDGYKAGAVCMFNSPRSVIVGNKKILAALRMPHVFAQFTPEQQEAITDYVPWTELLRDAEVEHKGRRVDLRDFVIRERQRLVLKASRSYGGKDVVIGYTSKRRAWRKVVDDHIDDHEWVVQELVPIPTDTFPVVDGDGFDVRELNVNINPVAYGGQYTGSYCRVSEDPIINVSAGGGLIPTFTVDLAGDPAPPEP